MIGKDIGAVIFDMDDALVNTESHYAVIEQNMFRTLGLKVSEKKHKFTIEK